MKGQDFYTAFKKNNVAVWTMCIITILSIVGAFLFSFSVYQNSTNNIYGINEKGELIPLKKLEIKEANLIQAKANLEYFVEQYYSLNAYSMKRKRERAFWLVGKQPAEILKDRHSKGYFDEFLSVAGLTQNAEILQHTLKISDEAPYEASCIVRIERVNGGQSTYYNSYINLKMEKVNRNYPYNPYGLLITQFSENIQKIDVNEKEEKEELEKSEQEIKQNSKDEK